MKNFTVKLVELGNPFLDIVDVRWGRFHKLKVSREYKDQEALIKKNANLMYNTMRIGELIDFLSDLDRNDFVCITQSGYYAEGERAEVFAPQVVGRQELPFGNRTVHSIGHSSQYY